MEVENNLIGASLAATAENASPNRRRSLTLDNDLPEINLEQVQLQFNLRNEMRDLLVENNQMYILTMNYAYRIDLGNPLSVLKVVLPGDSTETPTLTNAWLNQNGDFLIVQMNNKNHYLLHSSYSQFKPLPRLKGLPLEFLIFGQSDNFDTGDFVASTGDGIIYAVSVKFHDPVTQANKRDDKLVRQVYSTKYHISGMLLSLDYKAFQIFTADGAKLSWTCHSSTTRDLIEAFRDKPTEEIIADAQNHIYVLKSFYYCSSGTSGKIVSNDPNINTASSIFNDWKPYNFNSGKQVLLATDYFLILVTPDSKSLVALSKIGHTTPLVIPLSSIIGEEKILGATEESNGQTRWLYTQNNVYEIIISNEYFSLWRTFYNMGKYEQALKMVEASPEKCEMATIKNIIYVKQAYQLLQEGGLGLDFSLESSKEQQKRFECFKSGIKLLAKSQEPFEKVTLMLLSVDADSFFLKNTSRDLLKDYLSMRFDQAWHAEEKMNYIILSSWIVKTYLEAIQKAEASVEREAFFNPSTKGLQLKSKAESKVLEASMFSFLENNIEYVDRKTVYQLMIKMGFGGSSVKFAELLNDYQYIVYHHIENESWSKAIQAMKKLYLQESQKSIQVILDTSFPVLLRAPQITTEFWLTLDDFDFEKLLPAILHFNQLHMTLSYSQNPIFRFFSKLIFEKGIISPVINNQYLSLMICHSISSDDSQITKDILKTLEFLRSIMDRLEHSGIFDADFLLRSCLRFRKIEPAISILMEELKQYDTALILALKNGSCRLGETILLKFDKGSKYRANDNMYVLQAEGDVFSGHDFSSTRLEDSSLKFRKTLWFIYARYLINGVCNGTHFDVPIMSQTLQAGDQKTLNEKIKVIDSVEQNFGENVTEAQSFQLSRVLSYLFTLSKSFGGSGDLLSFKDLLPLLPESVLINHFRDDIVQSLHHYNNQINHLGLEMQESAITASKLKAQVAESNFEIKKGQVITIIEPGESCCLCQKILIEKNILVFPNCHHGCHKECAARYFLRSKGDYRFKKLIQNFKHSSDMVHKNALDKFLIKACPLCNESNLNSLDEDSIDFDRNDADIADWSISHVTFSRV